MSELLPDAANQQAAAHDFLDRVFHPPTGTTWMGTDLAHLPRSTLIEIILYLAKKEDPPSVSK